jgi:hypothetical protein
MMSAEALLYQAETYALRGACFEVYKHECPVISQTTSSGCNLVTPRN